MSITVDNFYIIILAHPVSVFSVRENVCNNSKKRKKSCFLDFDKRRKNVKSHILFIRPLNHSAFNTQLPKVSTISH